jgi:methenyltetrahydrofolate cyclohydrolase
MFKLNKSQSMIQYLKELSSSAPSPGGGSVAGIAGALGAGLICKVANLTIGKEKYKEYEEEMIYILNQGTCITDDFYRLSVEDAKAYKKLSSVFKLPKEKRKDKLQDALKEAIEVPIKICKLSKEGIKLCLPLTSKGNKNLITDVGIASLMLKCAFESALFNVEINLKSIKDPNFILKIGDTLKPIEENINSLNEVVMREVEICLAR